MTEKTAADDITIEYEDDVVPAQSDSGDSGEPKVEKAAPKVDSDPGIDDLKAQLAEQKAAAASERQRALEAQQAAQAERQRAQQLEGRALNSDYHMVQNAIEAHQQAQTNAKAEYATAMEQGDYRAAADAQEKIAGNAARLVELERGKQAMQRKAEQQKVEKPAQPQQASSDTVEQYINQFSPKSQEWLRAHREFVTDPKLNNRMIGAHHMALAEGYTAETPEYFAYLEKNTAPSMGSGETKQTKQANVSAPVSRDPPAQTKNGLNMRGSTIKLSKEQVEAAAFSGIDEKTYALSLLDAANKGEIGNKQ